MVSSRGMAYFKSSNIDMALQDFNRVLELDPSHAMARYARAGCYNISGEFNEAIEDYTFALKCDDKNARTRTKLYLHETAEKVIHEKMAIERRNTGDENSPLTSPYAKVKSVNTTVFCKAAAVKAPKKYQIDLVRPSNQETTTSSRVPVKKARSQTSGKKKARPINVGCSNPSVPPVVTLDLSTLVRKKTAITTKKPKPVKKVTIKL